MLHYFLVEFQLCQKTQESNAVTVYPQEKNDLKPLDRPKDITPHSRLLILRHESKTLSADIVSDSLMLDSSRVLSEKLPRKWVLVRKINGELVEYKPCNGINPTLEFIGNHCIINFSHESLVGYVLRQSQQYFDYGKISTLTILFEGMETVNMRIIENEVEKLAVFHWDFNDVTFEWIMSCDREKLSFVANPCRNIMLEELKFDMFNVDSLLKAWGR